MSDRKILCRSHRLQSMSYHRSDNMERAFHIIQQSLKYAAFQWSQIALYGLGFLGGVPVGVEPLVLVVLGIPPRSETPLQASDTVCPPPRT